MLYLDDFFVGETMIDEKIATRTDDETLVAKMEQKGTWSPTMSAGGQHEA